ncbi:uncharacterized protein LOC108625228 [Ceratina calcarata]|uniref:Uncharacterized protein LOC108625228 n=1 Tax=Ceratina calcarata TaxID=156304 RepID=A0AAJ7IZ78_9HYME|nr:uncharacterized protein LOC108625228 [Ceratina calcarata]
MSRTLCKDKFYRHETRSSAVEQNRIQKLLASEYSDFADVILVESPFAETTRNGRGIRQVSLALSPSKLIIAADVFKGNSEFLCPRDLDPSIESFELISLYPLQCVSLSVFSRRHRKTLKARFIDGKVSYYELGGIHGRNVLWREWCEQVESLLGKRMDGSSLSETTAASSSSSSTLYMLSSEIEIRKDRRKEGKKAVCRVWAHYGGAGDYAPPTWRHRDLYLGPSYNELVDGQYTPIPIRFAGASLENIKDELKDFSPSKGTRSWPRCRCFDEKYKNNGGLCDVLFIRDHNRKYFNANKFFATCQSCPCNRLQIRMFDNKATKKNVWYDEDSQEESRSPKECVAHRISRFGIGVPEKCHSGLVLGPVRTERECLPPKIIKYNFHVLMEDAVKAWEGNEKDRQKSSKYTKHFRRYGLCTAPHFLYALGPWSVQPGERSTLQGRRSFSLVTIRRQPNDSELRLPVSRRQLAASVSYTGLQSGRFGSIGISAKGRVVLFWTPEFWYRPRPASAAYRELRRHLDHLRNFRQGKERPSKRKLFCRRKKCQCEDDSAIVAEEKPSFLERIFSGNGSCKKKKKSENQENAATAQLTRLLRMDFRITIWDINSNILATQLTLIDRDLFVRIPAEEIEILVFQRSSRNAPNFAAWIAFGHRVSCLTVSEILAVRKLTMRGRIIARFINAARKCFSMGNFHSCRSILAGLQAPAIFRLRHTWSYLRTHHALRYEAMERLSKLYKSPCTVAYRRAWAKAEDNPPCMPHVGDLLVKLLNLNKPKHHQEYNHINRVNNKPGHRKVSARETVANNKEDSVTKSNQSLEHKQSSGKSVLASVLNRMKHKRDQKTIYEEKTDLAWTTREQDLAWKYFYRWNNIVLRRKILLKEQYRLRDMDPKMKRVLEVVTWLMDCQKRAQGYEFPGHSFTREFLLKARYREDRENFFISLKLEPSTIT